MAVQSEEIRGYAFVDTVSKPNDRASSYQRLNIVLDVISASAFQSDKGIARDPKDLSIIRIMSTLSRLQSHFSLDGIAEGEWFEVIFQYREGEPLAWVLDAANDYSGPIRKTNLVGFKPLSMRQPGSPEAILLSDLLELCSPARKKPTQNLQNIIIPSRPNQNFFVRVVDGQASFSAIHSSRSPDSNIVGYFDVGGPAFFHHHTFPKVFNESTRVPDAGFVALSHWDFDHFSLALTKLKALQQLMWYAPDQNVGPNAARLQSLLGGRLTLLVQPSFQIARGLQLWKGNGSVTDRNASGYVLTVSGQETKALLTGDIPYAMIPANVKNN